MTCLEAREGFSALLDGDIGLTDSVTLEVHLRTCAECRREIENLRNKKASARPLARLPRLRQSVTPRIHARFLPIAASVMLVAVLVLVTLHRRAELELVFRHLFPSVPSIHDSPPQPAPVLVASINNPAAPSALSTPPTAGGAQFSPVVVRDPRAEPSAKPRAIKPGRPEQQIPKSKSGGTKRKTPSGKAPSSPAPVAARAAAPGNTQRPVDVVGRLLVKNRSGAERDVAALLARAGGTTLSRQRGPTITVVEGVVPHSNYGSFAADLRGIGSWQIEAERSPLPDVLHVTVQLAE